MYLRTYGMRCFVYTLLFGLLAMALSSPGHAAASESAKPEAVQGELNLRQHPLQTGGPVLLNGEWAFAWNRLLTFEDLDSSTSEQASHYVAVPDTWTRYAIAGQPLPGHGYATYRLVIHLHEDDQARMLSLYMPSVATAYELWVNGEWLAGNGTVGTSRQTMVPQNYARTVTFQASGPRVELLLHVSNFHQRKAGLWESIMLGTEEQVRFARERNVMQQSFVVGCILIIGIYHVALFLFRRRDLSPLLLALACFGVGIRTLLLKDTLLVWLYPGLDWEIAVRIEYLTALGSLVCFLLFARRELFPDLPLWLTRLLTALLSFYSLFVLLTPARIYTMTFWLFQLLVLGTMTCIVMISILGMLRKREGASLNFAAMIILFTAVLNDLLYYRQWIMSDEWTSVGLLFYLLVQSVHLARRFSKSFSNVEKLSQELKQLNRSLELQVEQRTAQWREANSRLQKIEASRRRLLASVSHELNTPLTIIQGSVKAMIDGVISRDDSSYLRMIYRDTQMMSRVIRDLQELSLLESDAISFQFEPVEMRSYLLELYEEHRPVIERNGIKFNYQEDICDQAHERELQIICRIDRIRIKQAVVNLLMNAQRYTKEGGTITMETSLHPATSASPAAVRVGVRDTGAGIAESELPHLFQRFYKGNRAGDGDARSGAGLGLAIVKELVERHGGTIHVESKLGAGSFFYFMLPIVVPEQEGTVE